MKNAKKFDKNVLNSLSESIILAKKAKKDCKLNRKEINVIKHINPDYIVEQYDYSGRYPKRLGMFLRRNKLGYALNAIKKLDTAVKKKETIKTQEEINLAWAKRLVKLLDDEISLEYAIKIAEEKIEYKEKEIENLEEKQFDRYSPKRAVLISQIERSNPLRRIKDIEHAKAILGASNRHNNSDYELQLEEAKNLALCGNIDKSEVQEYARKNMSFV